MARRISRFLPSRRPTVSQAFAPCWRSRLISIPWKRSPSMVTPFLSGSSVLSSGVPFTRTRYFRSQPVSGSSSLRLIPPSLVRSSRPSELRSSRPMLITRGMSSGSLSKIVSRPFSSFDVVTSPAGLW